MSTDPESGTFDMSAVAEAINAAGFRAYVEQTGGGCATIYAYRSATNPAHYAAPDVMAGPGTFDWNGSAHVGWLSETSIGRSTTDAALDDGVSFDDEYSVDLVHATDSTTPAEIVEIIVRQLNAALTEYGPRTDA